MANEALKRHSIGWIGTGKMGTPMVGHLVAAGAGVAVWNRTRAKAEGLGADVVDSPATLADRDIVFSIVTDDAALRSAILGPNGLLSGPRGPMVLVDCSTVSAEVSAEIRDAGAKKGTTLLVAPVSGNGNAVKAGLMCAVVSGPKDAYDLAAPYLDAMGQGSTWVGEGDLARLVKVCHNVLLGTIAETLAEILVLAEKGGVPRHALLDFICRSVMGSIFIRYKVPAYVNLDFSATHTAKMLRKDLDIALGAARQLEVPMPITNLTRDIVEQLIGRGHGSDDFASLVQLAAENAGLKIKSENVDITDGLAQRRAAAE